MRTIRLKLEAKNPQKVGIGIDELTRKNPTTWRANATTFEVGAFLDGEPRDLTGFTALEIVVRPDQVTDTNLAYQTVAAPDSAVILATDWTAGTDQHVSFSFTDAEMNIDLAGATEKKLWLAVTAKDPEGNETTLGTGWFTLSEDNNASADPPPENPGAGITQEVADARYVGTSQADQPEGYKKLNAAGNLSVKSIDMDGLRIPVLTPSGFSFIDYGFNIYLNLLSRKFETSLNVADYRFSAENTYYVSTDGNDSTGIGSEALPWKTLEKAADESKLAGDSVATIIVGGGVYYRGETFNKTIDSTYPLLNVECLGDDPAILSTARRGVFSQYSGDTYKITVSGMICFAVVDLTVVDDFGFRPRLAKAADAASCVATPGSYYRSGDDVYVHKTDGSVPTDENTLVLDTTKSATFTMLGLFFSNIHFYGGISAAAFNLVSATDIHFFNKCLFSSSWNGAGAMINTNVTVGRMIYLNECGAAYGAYDGFNYHSSGGGGNVVEINCVTSSNGNLSVGNADNGTTVHDGISILRVNPVMLNEKNRAIHDIGAGHSWIVGGEVDGLKIQTPSLDSVAFYCGHPDGDTTKMWLDTCESRGRCAIDFAVADGCSMYVRNCGIGTYTVTHDGVSGTGTIERY